MDRNSHLTVYRFGSKAPSVQDSFLFSDFLVFVGNDTNIYSEKRCLKLLKFVDCFRIAFPKCMYMKL